MHAYCIHIIISMENQKINVNRKFNKQIKPNIVISSHVPICKIEPKTHINKN